MFLQSWGNRVIRDSWWLGKVRALKGSVWTFATHLINHRGKVLPWSLLPPQDMVGIHHLFEGIPTTSVIVHFMPGCVLRSVIPPTPPIVEAQKWSIRTWVTCPRSPSWSSPVWIWTQVVPSNSNRRIGHLCPHCCLLSCLIFPLLLSLIPTWKEPSRVQVLYAVHGLLLNLMKLNPFREMALLLTMMCVLILSWLTFLFFLWFRVVNVGENGGRFSLELGFRSFPELIAACCSIWLSEQHFEARISTITSSRDENDF